MRKGKIETPYKCGRVAPILLRIFPVVLLMVRQILVVMLLVVLLVLVVLVVLVNLHPQVAILPLQVAILHPQVAILPLQVATHPQQAILHPQVAILPLQAIHPHLLWDPHITRDQALRPQVLLVHLR